MFLSSSRRLILPLAHSSRSVCKFLSVLNNGNFLLCTRYHNSTSSGTSATVGSTPSSSPIADTVHKGMKGMDVPGSDHLEKLATSFSQLTLKEMNELQRLIFKKIGHSDDFYEKALLQGLGGGGGGGGGVMAPAITAAAPVGDAAAAAPPTPPKPEKKKVEKLTADVKLAAYAPEIKIKLIKELRTVTSMSIADAKKAVEKCPGLVATNLSKDDAEKIKVAFEKLGAKVEVI